MVNALAVILQLETEIDLRSRQNVMKITKNNKCTQGRFRNVQLHTGAKNGLVIVCLERSTNTSQFFVAALQENTLEDTISSKETLFVRQVKVTLMDKGA